MITLKEYREKLQENIDFGSQEKAKDKLKLLKDLGVEVKGVSEDNEEKKDRINNQIVDILVSKGLTTIRADLIVNNNFDIKRHTITSFIEEIMQHPTVKNELKNN
jgi:DNA invertase Pin-like site-specific DNA recombinase